jgi:hypothetical protein
LSTFQILGISLCSGFSLLVLLAIARKRLRPLPGFGWFLLWIAAAIAIANPELTVVLAQALGIQRGADLIFYLAILGMFAGFFLVYVRLRRLDEGMTTLVRRLAIAEARNAAELETDPSGAEGDATD